MALKSTKISRDVINSCKQFTARKSDIASISYGKGANRQTEEDEETLSYADENNIRYIVTNTKRPEILPKIEFPKDPEQLIPPEMRYLQPAMLPKFMELREDPENTKWEIKENIAKTIDCPFPEPIKELRTETITVSDKKKAELKMPSTLRVCLTNTNRHFSTLHFWIPDRSMSSNNNCNTRKCNNPKSKKSSGNYDSRAHCENDAPKVTCDPVNRGCPNIVLKDCVQSKKSDCLHRYVDPKCRKKNAPYPSYSESCAERLEDDPSECMQCPWQKCGGVDAIKPQRRRFHHMVSADFNYRMPPTITSLYSSGLLDMDLTCDKNKNPCKRPPGKCEEREELERRQEMEREKNRARADKNKRSKKDRVQFVIEEALFASTKSNVPKGKLPFDKNLGDYEYVRKRKCSIDKSKCHKEKRRIVPEDCYSDDCKKCDQREQSIMAFLNYECKGKIPQEDCPPIKITPRPIDMSINKMEMSSEDRDSKDPCKTNKKNEKPQCPRKDDKKGDICPKKTDEKIRYRKEKDLNKPVYS